MKNTKKLLVGVLSVAALLGTGVAAWTIGGELTNDSKEVKPTVETEVFTRDLALDITAVDETIVFDSNADLSVDYKVKAIKGGEAADDFDPYNLDNYKKVAAEYEPDLTVSVKAIDATTSEELDSNDPFFTYVKLPKAQEIHYEDWLADEYKDKGYPVNITLEWGEKYGNPQDYIDTNPEGWDQAKQREWINSVVADLQNVNFQFLFEVKGVEGEDVPPVEEETGAVTLPEVAGSTLSIDGYDPEKGTVTAGTHTITITTDEGKIVKDNTLTVVENGENKPPVELTESGVARATTHTYTATYNFVADATYSFKYEVVDETPDEPNPTEKFAVNFKANEFGKIEVKVDGVAIDSGDEIEKGKDAVITVTANEGYVLDELTVNDEVQALEGTTLTLKVDKALNIVAEFTYTKLVDVAKMDSGVFTTRGYYMGKSAYTSFKNYEAVYIGDGTTNYMLYRVSPASFGGINFDDFVIGETILEATGTASIYNKIPEGKDITDLKIVESDENLVKPSISELNAENPTYEFTDEKINSKVAINGAVVTEVSKSNKGHYTIDFSFGGEETYVLFVNGTNNDTTEVSKLKVGDKFSTNAWVGTGYNGEGYQFTYIEDFKIDSQAEVVLESVTLSADKNEIGIGGTSNIKCETVPAEFEEKPTFVSSDDKIATVDENGVVTGIGVGTATITATYTNGVKGTIEITVSEDTPVVENVTYRYDVEKHSDNTISNQVYRSAGSEDDILNALKRSKTIPSIDLITKVTCEGSVYKPNDETKGGIKFKNGSITITTSQNVSKMKLSIIAWKSSSETASVTVNDGVKIKAAYKDGLTVETFEFDFGADGTNTIKIAATNRFVITGFEFTLA